MKSVLINEKILSDHCIRIFKSNRCVFKGTAVDYSCFDNSVNIHE